MTRARAFFVAVGLTLVGAAGYFAQLTTDQPMGGAGVGRYRDGRGRIGRGGASTASAIAPFVLARTYSFPSTSADRVPLCTDDAECVAVCAVGAVTGSLSAWECKGHDGLAYGVVTDPGGTVVDSFIPGVKAREITGASAPSLASAALASLLNGSAHTLVIGGMSRLDGSSYEYWFQDTSGWFLVRENSGNVDYYDGINTTHKLSTINVNGYGIFSFRWNGTTGYSATGDWKPETATETIATARNTITSPFFFGTRPSRDLQLSGPAVFYAFYSAAKSDAAVQVITNKFYGVYNSGMSLTGGGGYLFSIDNTAVSGNFDVLYAEGNVAQALAPSVTAAGLRSIRGHTNTWAADPFNLASDTDIGTPTVNANVSSGPFAVSRKAAECDELVASNVAALDGKRGATAGTAAGPYNVSAILKAGLTGVTRTKAQLCGVVAGGTGSACCNITGLTSTAARYSCGIVAVGGSITSVKPEVRVGNATPEVGSIQVCHRQHTAGSVMEPPDLDNVLHGDIYYTSGDPAGWSSPALGAKYEVVHTPLYDPLTQWYGATDAYYLFDVSHSSGSHSVGHVFGYTVAGRFLAIIRGPADEMDDIVVDGIGLTISQPYATSTEWRPTGARDSTSGVLAFDAQSGNFTVGLTVTGATSHATGVIAVSSDSGSTGTIALTSLVGTFVDNEAITDTSTGAATVNGPIVLSPYCSYVVRHNSCGATAPALCRATDVIATDSTGTKHCPGVPDLMTLGNRYNAAIPTSVLISAVRVYSL